MNVTESMSTHTSTIAEESPIHTTTCTDVTTVFPSTVKITLDLLMFSKDSTPVANKSTTSLNNVLAILETVSMTGETNTSFHTTLTDNTTTWLVQLKLAMIPTKNGKLADQLFQ